MCKIHLGCFGASSLWCGGVVRLGAKLEFDGCYSFALMHSYPLTAVTVILCISFVVPQHYSVYSGF